MPLSDMTPTELAYLAGIMDGEGSISLVRSCARASRRHVYPLVRVANTDLLLIEWLGAKTGIGHRKYGSRIGPRFKLVHHIAWASNHAIELLRAIEPYLILKRDRAKIVIELHDLTERVRNGGRFGHGNPIPDALVEARDVAFARMKELNRRGVPCP